MKHKVRVFFAGVITVGPARPKTGKPPYRRKGPFFAICAGSSRRKAAYAPPGGRPSSYIPFHLPAIVMSAPIAPGSRPPDEPGTKTSPSIWYPFRERLVFEIDKSSKPTEVTYEHEDPPKGERPKDGDFDLIADVREIWPEKSMTPEKAVSSKARLKDVPRSVSGQVFIPGGKLSSSPGKQAFVTFRPSRLKGKDLSCWIASEAILTFSAESIRIKSFSLDTGKELDPILLKELSGDVDIRIENADPQDIHHQGGIIPFKSRMPSLGRPDPDFELYYTVLAARMKTILPIPIEDQTCPKQL